MQIYFLPVNIRLTWEERAIMNHCNFLKTVAAFAAGPIAPRCLMGASPTAKSTPNIVVLLTENQGYADMSFNPNHPKEASTPNMSALVKEGLFFTQAYTSGAVCFQHVLD
jgi:hypothetical protein